MSAGAGFVGRFRPGDGARATVAADTQVWFEGELHNLAELRRALALCADTSLVEVLAAAWRRWGDSLGDHLNGVFALVAADHGRLLLLRDASGLRNLYADTGQPGELWFGSALGPLMRRPGARRRLARAALHEYLRLGDIAAPRTIYEGVVAAEPGVPWLYSGNDLQGAAASSASAAAGTPPIAFDEAVDALDALLREAVARRLDDAERPAAFLSGGVDSALICALARPRRGVLTALTVGFDAAGFDESSTAGRIAARLGLRHEVLRFGRESCLQGFERLAAGADQPTADPSTAITILAFDHCRRRFDAVLDGTGADESVGMMPPRHVRTAVAYAALLPTGLRRRVTALLGGWRRTAPYARLTDFEHPAETMMRWRGFQRADVEALCGEPVSFADTRFVRTFAGFARTAHFERYSALVDAMPCERLNQAARVSGLTVRFPYADSSVDRYLRQLRTEHRYLPGQPKRILRALLARYVPAELWNAPKHGFDFPLHEFLAGAGYSIVRRYLDPRRWSEGRVLDANRVARCAAEFMAGDAALTFRVWSLVLLGAWLEAHVDMV